jgi:hypothetical protein
MYGDRHFLLTSLAVFMWTQEASANPFLWQCPAGYQCTSESNTTTMKQCDASAYSMLGWGQCCNISQALACGTQSPGHYALDSRCHCSPVSCVDTGKDIMRGTPGQLVCERPRGSCREACPSASRMVRERYSCNCLRLSYPCLSNEVLWGSMGGPYQCIALQQKKR